MLTMRKKSTALLMLTQSVTHLADSRAGKSIFESLATKVVFPNPTAEAEAYAALGFSETEQRLATAPSGGRRLAIVLSDDDHVILDCDLSGLGDALNVLSGGRSAERLVGADWRHEAEFWRKCLA